MESHFIEAAGINTHYLSYGEGEEVLIFLHGWGGSTESFEVLGPQIADDNNLKIIIPDLPGFGKSGNPSPEGWSTHDYEVWFSNFLTQLNITSAHFYGHSFGCRVGIVTT